jgi:lipoprotein-releasing system permease protein
MRLELELAVRFLRRRSGLLLRGTSMAALAGVGLATCALVITLALMSGYTGAITAALQRGNAHVVGFAGRPMAIEQAHEIAMRLLEVDGVTRATPVSYLPGLIDDPLRPANPLPITIKAVAVPPAYTELESWPSTDGIPTVFGARLAETLDLEPGDIATVRLPPERGSWIIPALPLRMIGSFRLEFAEFDESWTVAPLDAIIEAVPGTGVAGVELELTDPLAVESVRGNLEEAEPSLLFADWREMNRSLFAGLRWVTLSLFVVLSLVVVVASFQVSSALVVLAIDKRRTAGMLHALGATPGVVRNVLVLAGLMLGSCGVIAGLVLGCIASWLMTTLRVVRFPAGLARVYLVDFIPFRPEPLHLLAILGVCLALVFLASLWPAWKSSREDPVSALRSV